MKIVAPLVLAAGVSANFLRSNHHAKFDQDQENGKYYVRYSFVGHHTEAQKANIRAAANEIAERSCLVFLEDPRGNRRRWNSSRSNIRIGNNGDKCYAYQGSKLQYKSYNSFGKGCQSGRTAAWQFMMILGGTRETTRKDARNYVSFDKNRFVNQRLAGIFSPSRYQYEDYGTNFDCKSASLPSQEFLTGSSNGRGFWSNDANCQQDINNMSRFTGLSDNDFFKLNNEYYCPDKLKTNEPEPEPLTEDEVFELFEKNGGCWRRGNDDENALEILDVIVGQKDFRYC